MTKWCWIAYKNSRAWRSDSEWQCVLWELCGTGIFSKNCPKWDCPQRTFWNKNVHKSTFFFMKKLENHAKYVLWGLSILRFFWKYSSTAALEKGRCSRVWQLASAYRISSAAAPIVLAVTACPIWGEDGESKPAATAVVYQQRHVPRTHRSSNIRQNALKKQSSRP